MSVGWLYGNGHERATESFNPALAHAPARSHFRWHVCRRGEIIGSRASAMSEDECLAVLPLLDQYRKQLQLARRVVEEGPNATPRMQNLPQLPQHTHEQHMQVGFAYVMCASAAVVMVLGMQPSVLANSWILFTTANTTVSVGHNS